MSELTDTQREDLRVFAESINGSEASYGAMILRLMTERDELNTKLEELNTKPQLHVVSAQQVVFEDIANAATELAEQRLISMNKLSEAIAVLRKEKDAAYAERNAMVSAFTKLAVVLGWEAWIGRHNDLTHTCTSAWDEEWLNVVYVQTPHGQVSWHIHDSEVEGFAFLARRDSPGWDGHTTEEKYARLTSMDVDALKDGMRSFLADIQMNSAEEAQNALREPLDQLERVAKSFVLKQNELAPGDFASVEFDTLVSVLGLREIVPDCVIQERLHQEMDDAHLSEAVVED